MIRIKVLDEKKNPILKRTDLMLMVNHIGQPTPKMDEVIKKMVEKFKTLPEKVEVVYIFSQKGIARSKVKARIWKDKAPVKKVKKKEEKPKGIKEEKKVPKEKKVEEKPKEGEKTAEKEETKKPETPKEGKKIEKTKEEKKSEGEKSET